MKTAWSSSWSNHYGYIVFSLQGYIGKRIRFRKLFWSDHHVYISSWSTSSSQSIIWYSSFKNYIVKMVVFGNKISLQIVIKWSSWHPGSMLQWERARERERSYRHTEMKKYKNITWLNSHDLWMCFCLFCFCSTGKKFQREIHCRVTLFVADAFVFYYQWLEHGTGNGK